MSEKGAGKNKGTAGKKTKRNKKTDADGVPYDKRKGDYTAIDHALEEEEDILHDWLTPERCEIELTVRQVCPMAWRCESSWA